MCVTHRSERDSYDNLAKVLTIGHDSGSSVSTFGGGQKKRAGELAFLVKDDGLRVFNRGI